MQIGHANFKDSYLEKACNDYTPSGLQNSAGHLYCKKHELLSISHNVLR